MCNLILQKSSELQRPGVWENVSAIQYCCTCSVKLLSKNRRAWRLGLSKNRHALECTNPIAKLRDKRWVHDICQTTTHDKNRHTLAVGRMLNFIGGCYRDILLYITSL